MSTAADAPAMKVLFVRGAAAEADGTTLQQLRTIATELEFSTLQGSAEAIAEIRKNSVWSGLFVSPSLPHNETLALIATLRRDRVPMAIVPVIDETQQDLFAAAVASGADDVLLRRGQTLVNVAETITRMRQSPHLFPVDERRRVGVMYAGRDQLVWSLLEQVPFIRAEKADVGPDGTCPVNTVGVEGQTHRTDAVVIDEQQVNDAHPLQVLKSVKAQASDLPVIMLTSNGTSDVATAALELGADDTVLKTGVFRRRLIATLRRVYQRLELTMQQAEMRVREERLRQIVENVPAGITVISTDGVVLAMNAASLQLFGATKPRDVVGRDFRQFVAPADRDTVGHFLKRVIGGEPGATDFKAHRPDGSEWALTIRGVVLERDSKGTRGVIASIARAAAESAPTAPSEDRTELITALEAVKQLQLQRSEAIEAHRRAEQVWAVERDQFGREREQFKADRHQFETARQQADADRQQFEAERRQFENARQEIQAERARFQADRQQFEAERRQFENARQEIQAERAQFQEQRQQFEAARQQAEADRLQLEAARQKTADELKRVEAELERLARERRELTETVARLEEAARNQEDRTAQTLTGERARWDERRQQLEADLRAAREALWAAHAEQDNLRTTASAVTAELAELRSLLDSQRERATAEQNELAKLKQDLAVERDARLAEASTLDTSRRGWIDVEATLRADIAGARATIARLEEELAANRALAAERDETVRALASLREERAGLEARFADDLERAEEATRATAEEYDATRKRLEAERDSLRQELEAARRDTGDRQTNETAHLTARLTELEAEVERERREASRVAPLLESVASLEQKLSEAALLTARINELEAEITRERAEADRVAPLLASVTSLEQRLGELQARLDREHEQANAARLAFDQARGEWNTERSALLQDAREGASSREARTDLERSLQVLRSDYAAVVNALDGERTAREHDREEIRRLESAIAAAASRHAALERDIATSSREADEFVRRREHEHTTEVQKLERELTQNALRLSRVVEEADRARAALHAEFTRAAESHHRLIASDLFGYAVTTLSGELVRCNDAFARLLGFSDAPDAMTRTAGRTIPGLADRPSLITRLAADGQVTRVDTCLERADGESIRVAQSATLLSDPADAEAETLVEHVILGDFDRATISAIRAERLEAVGTLASEMAPEMEAMVTTLHEHLNDPDSDRRTVMQLTAQVAGLVRQLGAFSRRQMLSPNRVDLSQVVLAAEPTLIRLVGDYISFSTELEETGGVTAHVDDLDHVLTSLVTLGRDLLPAGGSIVVETRRPGAGRQGLENDDEGPRVAVSASGYGVQVPEGLGPLSQVIERAGGQLRVQGEPGWLVRLEVTFPRCGNSRRRGRP